MEGRLMILLEGNIGAGKSTLGAILKESGLFEFIPEPVEQWRRGFASNLLDDFYADQKRWAFTFQQAAFTTRAKTWQEVSVLTDQRRVVLERSIYADRYVFAQNAYKNGVMTEAEWQIYRRLWDWMEENWCTRPDRILYLRTPAAECWRRLKGRGRSEEQAIPMAYLEQLEALHDQWLLNRPEEEVVVLDGERRWTADQVAALLGIKADPASPSRALGVVP